MELQRSAEVGLDNHREALSIWLDLFRWLAAFLVLIEHVRHRVFMPFSQMPHEAKTPLFYLVGGVSSFGSPAVVVFFVLSGFLVGGGSLRRYLQTGVFIARDYFIARFARLWIVLIPTFCLTWLLNAVGAHVSPGNPVFLTANDAATFLCNTAFLQTAACNQYGNNGALWSLFNEFWYYVAWPPIMLALFSRYPMALRMGLGVSAFALLAILSFYQFVGSHLLLYFSLWLLGVLGAVKAKPLLRMHWLVSAAMAVAALLLWRIFTEDQLASPNLAREFPLAFLIGLTFTNLIMNMKEVVALPRPPLPRLHEPLAAFSFSLYCTHTPVINCFVAVLMWYAGIGGQMVPSGSLPYLLYIMTIAICCLLAYAIGMVTERHTNSVRKALSRRLLQWKSA